MAPIHRTDNDILNGNLEGSPRLRVNRSTALALSTSWQRVDFNGVSSVNVNTFPDVDGQGTKKVRWDSVNKVFLFSDTVDRNYNVSLFMHLVASALLTGNAVQMRYVIPNGNGLGNNFYFPFPDDGGFKEITTFAGSADKRVTDNTIIYVNQMIRDNGLGIELKMQNSFLATVNLTSSAFIIYGR
ncbi:hypothetical protein J0X19_11760 [Hymenobacter sp. BT186]|uniref:Uncharacterized protein n=1 Tax=Hymenobacter telluris TaxID=2816474 RepID=A0A939EWD0_9BACT|nr:hypothetical protein [Hymenobacter telluris]MBO0358623.1 hypothetical protein [Hymenobacter telluris]MBW3374649.1 hypothetical protein [Hymenobacter norwichensis]